MTWALWTLLATTVLAFGGTPLWATALFECGVLALVILPIAGVLRRPSQARFTSSTLVLAAVPLWGAIQHWLGIPGYPARFWAETGMWLTCAALYWTAQSVFRSERTRLNRFLEAMFAFAAMLAGAGLLAFFTAPSRIFWLIPIRAGEPMGPFVNRDHWAVFAEMMLPIGVYCAGRARSKLSWRPLAIAALVVSVVVSGSRAGSVFSILSLSAAILAARRRTWMTGLVAASICAGILALTGPGRIADRLKMPDPLGARRDIWLATGRMIVAKPIAGHGLGMYESVYPAYAATDFGRVVDHAHNDWAEWMAEGGIPLIAAILAFVALTAAPAWRSVWGIGALAAFAHALVDFPFRIPALAALVFVILAAAEVEYSRWSTARRNATRPAVIELERDYIRFSA